VCYTQRKDDEKMGTAVMARKNKQNTGLILAYKTGNFETAGKENFKNLHI